MADYGEEFEKIYVKYFNDVFLFLKRLSKDEGIAEEITSETFFKAMRSIDSFRGETDIRVWLCQIAKNCYFSHLKRQQKFVDLNDLEIASNKDTLEEQILNRNDAMRIHHLLHDLAEPYKEVFMLRVFGELSFKQIADIFQKTDNWACVTYHRARNNAWTTTWDLYLSNRGNQNAVIPSNGEANILIYFTQNSSNHRR